jgi:hypothetical protein
LKVAIPAEGRDLDAKVGDRLGLSSHLLVIDMESKDFEAYRSPRASGSGAMMGVVFLVGLFSTFISEEALSSFFSGTLWQDSFRGALGGSAFAGNPVNSYIIGGKLLNLGVSPVAVSAFMCSWVTVGLVQLPAEIASLGWRFAMIRNLSCFVLSMALSVAMMPILTVFGID